MQRTCYLNGPIMGKARAVQPEHAPQHLCSKATSSPCSPCRFDLTRWTSTLLSTTLFSFSISSTVCFTPPPLTANLRKKHRDAYLYNFTEAEAAQHSTRWHLHAARHAWLQAEDLEEREEIPAYALSELNVKYKAPLRSQDWYIVTVGIKEYTRTRVVCAQRVIRLDPESEQADRVRHSPYQCAHASQTRKSNATSEEPPLPMEHL